MSKNIIVIFFILFSSLTNMLYANNSVDYNVLNKLIDSFVEKNIDRDQKIHKQIIKSIMELESNKKKYAVLVKTKKNKLAKKRFIKILKYYNIRYYTSKRSRFVSIYPKNIREAKIVYKLVNNFQNIYVSDWDLGLMQINRRNFEYYDLGEEYFTDYKKNFIFALFVYNNCYKWAKKLKLEEEDEVFLYTIECYNKGKSKRKIDNMGYKYAEKFIEIYKRNIAKND